MKKVRTAEVLEIVIKYIKSENMQSYIYIEELLKELEKLKEQEGTYESENSKASN